MSEVSERSAPQRARDAVARGDWAVAFDLLVEGDASSPLSPEDLMFLAEAAYGAGHLEATFEALEKAHAANVGSGDRVAAAGAAARIAMHLIIDTGLLAPVRGWIKRAERLLEGCGITPVHAWLGVARGYERLLTGDPAGARPWTQQAIDAGTDHDEPAAVAMGRIAQARCDIFDGRLDEGLRLLDDTAASIAAGELDPLTTGLIYCEIVCAWQGLAMYDLAEEWTDAMERFSDRHGIGSVNGRCRIHRAEILRLRGACRDAEEEALAACEQLRPYMRREFGWPLTELGRIRLRMDDHEGAEEAFVAAHEKGWEPQPGFALLRLAQGDVTTAAWLIREALERPLDVPSKELPPSTELRRAPLLEAQVEIAIAAGDMDTARGAADELGRIAETYTSKALEAAAALACGRVRLAEDDVTAARRSFRTAVRMWSEIAAPYETALARMGLAQAYRSEGNEEGAVLEFEAARSAFERVGAPDQAELASLASRGVAGERSLSQAEARSEPSRFSRDGDYWTITFDGESTLVRDMKGLRYLAHLLGEAGRELHVVDLVALERGDADHAGTYTDGELSYSSGGDAGALLDDRAKAMYRRRLAEIDEDIEEARALGDPARATRARSEQEFLMRELSRAVGMDGRDRRAGATSERARASVTRAIRHAMTRIRDNHPGLGAHLDRTVRTGTYCAYLPDPRAEVDWSI